MTSVDWLLLAKGPLFNIALIVFVVGITVRIVEILSLGQRRDWSPPRANAPKLAGVRTIATRFIPEPGILKRAPILILAGYVFHIGLLVAIFLFIPHIEIFHQVLGLRWPGLPTGIVDGLTVASLLAMLALLAYRLTHPVLRFLSRPGDYIGWALTFLPLLTGYLAFHHPIGLSYPLLLTLHILSVELLLVAFPFTRLMHAVTTFMARWYSGVAMGRKGAL